MTVAAHISRVCLIVGPETVERRARVPADEFLRLYREQGSAMTAELLCMSQKDVQARVRRLRSPKPRPKRGPQVPLPMRLAADVTVARWKVEALELRVALMAGAGP